MLHCNNVDCTGGDEDIETPHPSMSSSPTSLTLDSNGFPVVSFRDLDFLKVMHCNDVNCGGGGDSITLHSGGGIGRHSSLALDGSGFPVISHYRIDRGDLKVLSCVSANC